MEAIWNQRFSIMDIAWGAGEAIKEKFKQSNVGVETKHDNSPVTEADMAAHHIIERGLRSLTPDIPLLSEESSNKIKKQRQQWPAYWLVDPLDGTKEFIAGSGEFSVNIALIENHKPIFGLIYIPMTETFYYAAENCGAWKQDKGESPESIQTKPYSDRLLVTVSSRTRQQPIKELLQDFVPFDLLIVGSSLKMCLIAEGEVDVYPRLGDTSEWDTAAAQIILEQAGGAILDSQFKPLRYNLRPNLINPNFIAVNDAEAPWLKRINKSLLS